MGYGSFKVDASAARAAMRSSTGTSAFMRDADIHSGKISITDALHESLDLRKKPRRECRDNADNPLAIPIGIVVDVTGSMGQIADLVIKDLHKVIKAIQGKKVVEYPVLCFGAVGDATCDRVPIQVGEFESDDDLAEGHLSNIYREEGGGGQSTESYELPMWFFANQVEADHWDKRGEKGFLFLVGDEAPYRTVRAEHLRDHLGVTAQDDEDLEAVSQKLQEKWHVFILRPGGTCHFNDSHVINEWKRVLPDERVIQVADWHEIVGMIAGTISVMSGLSVDDAMAVIKAHDLHVGGASDALAKIASSAALVATGGDLASEDSEAGAGAVRL